eukprot:6203269-Pleurochrysis_carterae.AAC.1
MGDGRTGCISVFALGQVPLDIDQLAGPSCNVSSQTQAVRLRAFDKQVHVIIRLPHTSRPRTAGFHDLLTSSVPRETKVRLAEQILLFLGFRLHSVKGSNAYFR